MDENMHDDPFQQCLGCPIPLDEHAVSVTIPTWYVCEYLTQTCLLSLILLLLSYHQRADVVGYEEGDPRVLSTLKIGYPRFKIHANIEMLGNICIRRRNKRRTAQSKFKPEIPIGHTEFTWIGRLGESIQPPTALSEVPCGHTSFSWNRNNSWDQFLLDELVNISCFLLPSKSVAERFKAFMVIYTIILVHSPFTNYHPIIYIRRWRMTLMVEISRI